MEDNKRMPEGVERLDNDDLSQVSGGRLVAQTGTSNAPSAVLITSVRHL